MACKLGPSLVLLAVLAMGPAGPNRHDIPAIVSLSLTRHPGIARSPAGSYSGVAPGILTVHVGDRIAFANEDADRRHTATSIENAVKFSSDPRFTDAALRASGDIGDEAWSTGSLAPGSRSRPLAAKKAGTYLYGCFFDYSAGMRGEIIVLP